MANEDFRYEEQMTDLSKFKYTEVIDFIGLLNRENVKIITIITLSRLVIMAEEGAEFIPAFRATGFINIDLGILFDAIDLFLEDRSVNKNIRTKIILDFYPKIGDKNAYKNFKLLMASLVYYDLVGVSAKSKNLFTLGLYKNSNNLHFKLKSIGLSFKTIKILLGTELSKNIEESIIQNVMTMAISVGSRNVLEKENELLTNGIKTLSYKAEREQ